MQAVSKTAYYCAGVRMQDAASTHPVIGDNYAKRLLGQEGLKYWQEFKQFTGANAGNVARHYIIDSALKEALREHPDATIILIGAGLDSRAYRLSGGTWIEIDETAIISYKNSVLPIAECPNKLERIPIDFEKDKLANKLSSYAGRPDVIIVIEGVFLYLSRAQKEELLVALTALFPKHTLLCDLMKEDFFKKYGEKLHSKLVEQGARFTDIEQDPDKLFIAKGYRLASVHSTIRTAKKLGLVHIPGFLLNLFLKKLEYGYAVYSFVYG